MKLLTFDSENMITQRKGDAFLSLTRKGANCISKAAAERTGFTAGDLVSLHQDEENPEDWYISLGESGFALRDDKDQGSLFFNNTTLSNTVLDALGIDEDRASFLLAGEPTVIDDVHFWALLTAKPIIKKKRAPRKK